MVFEAELTHLNAVSNEMKAKNGELIALAAARTDRAERLRAGAPGDDVAFLTGQDAAWSEWLSKRAKELSRDIAKLGAQREALRLVAKKAFGRQEALRQIRARQAAEARVKRGRMPY